MHLHIHIHHHDKARDEYLHRIFSLLNTIHMETEFVVKELAEVKAQLEKVKLEITAKDAKQEAKILEQQEKIATLEKALTDAGVNDEAVLTALAEVKASAQAVDDINEDAAPLPPVEEPAAEV